MPLARSRFAVVDEAGLGEVGLADTRHLAQQPPAERVDAVARDEVDRIDGVAERLADLAAVGGHVVVHEQLGRQREPGRQQDRGPDHRVEPDDALADHVPAHDRRRATSPDGAALR